MTRRPIRPTVQASEHEPGDVHSDELRAALSLWASGVTVVTVRDEAGLHGVTLTAFTALSVMPPLLLVCISEQAPLLTVLLEQNRFAINILAANQRRVANIFADRFAVRTAELGADADGVLQGAIAGYACTLEAHHPGGSHRIVVGRVERVVLGPEAPALLYHRRSYRALD
jgi:flavin reductase (NADH)